MEGLDALYSRVRRVAADERGLRLREKPFDVLVKPFAGVRGVIRDRGDRFEVRLSDLVLHAPAEVHESLAHILVGKIDGRLRARPAQQKPWRDWVRSPDVTARHDAARGARGRKRMASPVGHAHDLDMMFERLNAQYFEGRLERPRLGWSPTKGRSLYGHHDPAHGAIVLNRLLDHPRVPEFVVASILHHEMLHLVHDVRRGPGGRRIVHPRQFRKDEANFEHQAAARRFLKDLEQRRIRLRDVPPPVQAPKRPSWLRFFAPSKAGYQ